MTDQTAGRGSRQTVVARMPPSDKLILSRKQTTQNRHLRPQKIRGFGLERTWEESADLVADSESVTTLKLIGSYAVRVTALVRSDGTIQP